MHRPSEPSSKPVETPVSPTPKSARRRVASNLTLALCILYAVGTVGVWLLFRLAADHWWVATFLLFSPRWIWIMPLIVVLPVALIFRRRWNWLAVATAFFALFGLMGFRVPWRPAFSLPGKQSVRIVTANLHGREVIPAVLNDFLVRTQPDVIVLQDFDPRTKLPFLQQPSWHGRYYNGVLLASRWPMSVPYQIRLTRVPIDRDELGAGNSEQGVALGCRVGTPNFAFRLVGLHLASPHHALNAVKADRGRGSVLLARNSVRRWQESQSLRESLGPDSRPTILAGDFNTPDDSPIFRQTWSGFEDAFSTGGFGFGTTYAKHWTWLRIDHVLYNGGWHCRRCYTSGDVGSGHRAVLAELTR